MKRIGVSSFAAALFVLAACSSGGSNGSAGQSNCADICPGVVAAHCSLGPTIESDCESGCAALQASRCSTQYNALLNCGGPQPQFTCDSSGNVTVAGCEQQGQALYACTSGGLGGAGGSGGASGNDCASVCPKIVAAKCPNGPQTETDCENGCSTTASGQCAAQYSAVDACSKSVGASAPVTCNSSGSPVITGCETQYAQLYSCLGV